MSEGIVLRGKVLNEPEIAALDRVLPQVVDTFDPPARQRIIAGIALDGGEPSPGFALLSRRLMRCAKAKRGKPPAEAGMRRVMKGSIVTHTDVERLMDSVGRSVGPDDVSAAIERLSLGEPAAAEDGDAREEMLELCLSVLQRYSEAADPIPGEPAGPTDPYFGTDDAFAEIRDETDAASGPWGEPAMRANMRIGDLWDAAFRDALNGQDDVPLADLAGTMQVAIVSGFRGDPKTICQAIGAKLAGTAHQPVLDLVLVDEDALLKSKAHNTPSKIDALVRSLLDDGNFVVHVCAGARATPFVEAHAIRRSSLADCHPLLVAVVEGMAEEGVRLRRPDGSDATDWFRATAAEIPYTRVSATRAWLRKAYETGWIDARHEEVLGRIKAGRLSTPAPSRPGPANLGDVRGLDPATRRKLVRLGARLRSPDGARKGLLLSGLHGTGKTMLAGLLAKESGRHFVHGSLTEWQSAGYLNDFLAAMRGAFDEARRNAPSILFIDEADSIGNRGSTGSRNDDYWNMVVNCMLECLQGLGDRGDVAVIAATNHPDLIDPAIRREGRLGETIEIPMPTRQGRAEILASLLPADVRDATDLQDVADRLGPCSPAAIEGLVRDAGMLAREAGAPLSPDHVAEALRDAVGQDHAPRTLRAVAIGLAAETIMAALAYGDAVTVRSVSALPGLADRGRVILDHADGKVPLDTAGDRLRALHVALAPAAGRALVAAGGGRPDRDAMECFTHLVAHETEAALAHAVAIVDSGALSAAHGPDPAARGELARRTVSRAWLQVTAALRRSGGELAALADEIVRTRTVDGPTALAIATGSPVPTRH